MQILKDETRINITRAAKEEFLQKGFRQARMREIAKKTGISVSNIYVYFKNKDALFIEIVKPTMEAIKQALDIAKNLKPSKKEKDHKLEMHKQIIHKIVGFIFQNKNDLKLILFRANGSSVGSFKDQIAEEFSNIHINLVKSAQKDYYKSNAGLSHYFLFNRGLSFVDSIVKMIKNDVLRKDTTKYLVEIVNFSLRGIKASMK